MEARDTGNGEGGWEFYNLESDRIESHDLSGEMPDMVKELIKDYDH